MKTIAFTLGARRQFHSLPAAARQLVSAKIARYAQTGAGNLTALKGRPGARLRVGDYRVIFVEKDDVIEIRGRSPARCLQLKGDHDGPTSNHPHRFRRRAGAAL